MGMFDTYRPDPPMACPDCGELLDGWQGRDGPCAMLLWVQGSAEPLDQLVDDDVRGDRNQLRRERLPESFTIYTLDDQGHRVEAEGRAPHGVWVTTTLAVE